MRERDLVDETLDIFMPPFEHHASGWEDVLRRARVEHGLRTSRRSLLLVAAAGFAVVLAASAYALGQYFFPGDPAPPSVQEVVRAEMRAHTDRWPGIIVEETRAGAVARTSSGYVYLWVAPTRSGGECRFVHIADAPLANGLPNLSGGCEGDVFPIDADYSVTNVRGRQLRLLSGATAAIAAGVQVTYTDGHVEAIPLGRRHFLFEVGDEPAKVAAIGRSGDVIGEQTFMRVSPPPTAETERTVLSIRTARGRVVTLSVGAESNGTKCFAIRMRSSVSRSCSSLETAPTDLRVDVMQEGAEPRALVLLQGEVGSAIATLEVKYEDGNTESLPLVKGWTLFEVTSAHRVRGSRPTELIGRDQTGTIIARRAISLDPSSRYPPRGTPDIGQEPPAGDGSSG